MADLASLFSSLSPEDLEKIKAVAQNYLNTQSPSKEEKSSHTSPPLPKIENEALLHLLSGLPKELQRENDVTCFLENLKPLLSSARQKKVDEAIEFVRLMEVLPHLKGE